MGKTTLGNNLIGAMNQALNHARGKKAFAFALGGSNKTVEAWESGKNKPAGSAQRLLDMLMKDNSYLNF